jgi:hypothetical protein
MKLTQILKEASREYVLSEYLTDHLKRNVPLLESVFRYNSTSWRDLIKEVKSLHSQGLIEVTDEEDLELIGTDVGEIYEQDGKLYYLDLPMLLEESNEAHLLLNEGDKKKSSGKNEDKELNKPKRNSGEGKKYVVYVRDPSSGNVKKITFGDSKGGLTAKINDPEARKAFSARHNCPAKKDKLTPGYWACRLPRYAKSLGLAGSYKGYW